MNGAEKQIFDAVIDNGKKLAVLEATQKLQHEENRKDITRLYKWLLVILLWLVILFLYRLH